MKKKIPFKEQALTPSRLRDLLDYDHTTGIFIWRVTRSYTAIEGAEAGYISKRGYRMIKVAPKGGLKILYYAHRLAWLHKYGEWPRLEIDHVNGDRSDNRIANLRTATRSQNQGNIRKHKGNPSPYKGVRLATNARLPSPGIPVKWCAQIGSGTAFRHLGTFNTAEDAHAAYMRAAKEYYGEFANPG